LLRESSLELTLDGLSLCVLGDDESFTFDEVRVVKEDGVPVDRRSLLSGPRLHRTALAPARGLPDLFHSLLVVVGETSNHSELVAEELLCHLVHYLRKEVVFLARATVSRVVQGKEIL